MEESDETGKKKSGATLRDWFATLPTTLILLVVIFLGMGEALHSQLLNIGEQTWNSYFKLRQEIKKPDCDPNFDLDARVKKQVKKKKKQQNQGLGLLEPDPIDRSAIRKSLKQRRQECRETWKVYRQQKKKITPFVQFYRSVEKGIAFLKKISLNYTRHLLILLILITAATATLTRHHVVLRPQKTVWDHWVSNSVQLVANAFLLITVVSYWYETYIRSGSLEFPYVHFLWITGFGLLTLFSLYQLLAGVPDESWPEGTFIKTGTTVPLYAYIVIIGGIWFFFVEWYPAGMTVQLRKMERFSSLFLKVGLYVWTGMLLKWTRLTQLVLDLIRPWKLPPEYVVIFLVMLCAFPTAYSGASGIFVIAAGAVIYEELRKLGTRRQLSIATTAMSGSGVFLEPCLIVVIISALNKQITTDQLFQYGFYVYLLMGVVVTVLVLLTRRNELTINPKKNALQKSFRALLPLVPYILAGAGVILGFYYVLNKPFNEFSAPNILPFMLLVMVFYDQWAYGGFQNDEEELASDTEKAGQESQTGGFSGILDYLESVRRTVLSATSETTGHIGALLMLMATTLVLSGVVERSQVMTLFPSNFASVWTAMTMIVFVMIIIGMTMDPYGAVILVSATFAPVAYNSGIHPVHFWLVVLVAFELGYLTPPVALNQQFTRMVIGEEEYEAVAATENQYDSFWRNYEFLLLPIAVMSIVLLIVAYLPLIVPVFGS